MTGKPVHVGDITLRRPVLRGRDVAMVEDDHRPTAGWLPSGGHGQQSEDLETVGLIRGDVAAVVAAERERLLDDQVASWIVALAHRVDRERIEDLLSGRRLRRNAGGCRRKDRDG